MTATLITTQDIDAARQRIRCCDGSPQSSAAASLPPVSAGLVEALFSIECDHRTDQRSLRRAA